MGFVSIIWNVIVLVFVYIFLKKKVIIFFLFGDRTYSIRRRTLSKVLNEHIPYYVKKNFKSQLNEYYNGTLGKLEKEVKHAFKKRWNIAWKKSCKLLSMVIQKEFDFSLWLLCIDLQMILCWKWFEFLTLWNCKLRSNVGLDFIVWSA